MWGHIVGSLFVGIVPCLMGLLHLIADVCFSHLDNNFGGFNVQYTYNMVAELNARIPFFKDHNWTGDMIDAIMDDAFATAEVLHSFT